MIAKLIGPVIFAAVCAATLCGCGETPYRPVPYAPPSAVAPTPIICHDAIGHETAAKPWILGGGCCCTPTKQNYDLHVKQGTIAASMTYEAYLALYRQKGVLTDLDHRLCGGYCNAGPHVTLGGRCMATPIVGSPQHGMVTFGPHKQLTGQMAVTPVGSN